MNKALKYITCFFSAAVFLVTLLPADLRSVKAESLSEVIRGKLYDFGEEEGYDITSTVSNIVANENNSIGSVTVEGDMKLLEDKDGVPAFEVADDTDLTILFDCEASRLEKGGEWHLSSDSGKMIDGYDIDEKIGTGVLMLQTSLDNKRWAVNTVYTDLLGGDDTAITAKTVAKSNDIQLTNGCYYRVVAAYMTEFKTEGHFDITDLTATTFGSSDYNRYAEVYSFYASYKQTAKETAENEKCFNIGETVNAGSGDGYAKKGKIDGDDPHYGWEMGSFVLSGFTEKTDDNIFLKNAGDKLALTFNMKQDITRLNNDPELRVCRDKDGYDSYFQTPRTDMKHGTLIIRYTDYQGIRHDPVIYTDYLAALASPAADTKVKLFEEGDYEVALDYEIEDSSGVLKNTEDYRIAFDFKVRNGNCMFFPFDAVTNDELTESAVTENGFYIDLAKSRYLKINVTMARVIKGAKGYTEDIRFSRPAKDGEKYTEEGIYTIEAENPATGKTVEKKIYVGNDSVLKAAVDPANAAYTLEELEAMVGDDANSAENVTAEGGKKKPVLKVVGVVAVLIVIVGFVLSKLR